jgi:hypothetical protein
MENQQFIFPLKDNAVAYRSAVVKDFLVKNNVTIPHTLLTWVQPICTVPSTDISIEGTAL